MRVNEDLQRERLKGNFNVEELTNYLDEGPERTENRRNIENKVFSVKGLLDEIPEEYLSHTEKYENAIRKAVLYQKVMSEMGPPSLASIRANMRSMTYSAVFKDNSPLLLHTGMFIATIFGQGTEEQKEKWLPKAFNYEIIGTYAQTEMGHGSFIRGLETTATYDPKIEEFILNSPALSSYKWWPGGLGHTANYCIVMAQLYTQGKNHGIQPFLVQIRDEETHMPLKGIKVGEIGAKLGFNTVNNGFLGFENVRIPRDMMLMKYAQVLKDGTFLTSTNSKLTYGTMLMIRVTLVNLMANQLAKSVTIAVRYSAVRRQSQPKPNEPEPQILDYVTQQHKLFVAIASSHAYTITARWLWDVYINVVEQLEKGEMQLLPELHSLACCLKAVCTSDTAVMTERCRLACGGHGYMNSSNLPQIYSSVTAACTYEGENTVLMLQTARSLVKAWNQASTGEKLSATMSYLMDKTPIKRWDSSVNGMIKAFQKVALGKLDACARGLSRYTKKGFSPEDAWNVMSVQLVATSEAHCRAVLLSVYKSETDRLSSNLSPKLSKVLYDLVELYSIYWTLEKLGDMLLYTCLSESDVQKLQHRYEELLGEIRPNAVSLVDAFDFRDEVISSALGAYDGRVYERLMEEAMKSPLNAEPVNKSFHQYLKPFMRGKL